MTSTSDEIRRKKNIVGIVAIVLLLVITVVSIAFSLSFLVWILADVVVALVANIILRRIGRQQL